jgi:NAD(P)H-quinone oxidoreductase subunit 5
VLHPDSTLNRRQLMATTAGIATALSAVYFTLQHTATLMLARELPAPLLPDAFGVAIMLLVVVSFGTITLLQLAGSTAGNAVFQRAWVHLANGLYANILFNRLAGAGKRQAGSRRL